MTDGERSGSGSDKDALEVVLITGASGFTAAALVAQPRERYTVVGLDRVGPPDPRPPASAIGYDITGNPNPLYDKATVHDTRRLIDGLRSFDVEQFVFASTMLVHKPAATPEERISEESPIGASQAYPQSKVVAEALLHARRGKIPVVFLPAAGVYDGDGRSALLAQQISQIYEHRVISHFYHGMLRAASAHRDDLADAVLRLVDRRHDLSAELPLLIGAPGYAEIQDIVGEALDGEVRKTIRIPQPLAKAGIILQNEALGSDDFIQPWMIDSSNDHYILDISRARSLLGWQPKHSLRDTLPAIVTARFHTHCRYWIGQRGCSSSITNAWRARPPGCPSRRWG